MAASCLNCVHHPEGVHSIDDAPEVCWGCRMYNHYQPKDEPLNQAVEKPITLQEYTDKLTPDSPLDTQIGGDHYKKLKIQPMEYSMANGLDACQHTAIKYITRFRDKGGIQDLNKAKHCIDLLIAFEESKDNKGNR